MRKKNNLFLWFVYSVRAKARCRQAGFYSQRQESNKGLPGAGAARKAHLKRFPELIFFSSFSMSIISVCQMPKCHVLAAIQKCRCCGMSILFAEGNPGMVQLLLGADTGSVQDRVFEGMAEGEFAGKFYCVTEKLNFLFESL